MDQLAVSEYEDPIYPDVLRWVKARKTVTIVQTQRAFRLGFNRSQRLIERMEREGVLVGPRPNNQYRLSDSNKDNGAKGR